MPNMLAGTVSLSTNNKELLYAVLSALLCLSGAVWLIGPYFSSPNAYMYGYGGDALVIYYNIAYHCMYGSGDHLSNLNYPYGELIFLTDAQGSLSILLNWISTYIVDLCGYSLGIANALAAYLLLVCAAVVYYLLRALNVSILSAVIFSVLITLLAPEMLRLPRHFGLAYPFIIPLTMLWSIRKYNVGQFEFRDLFMFALLLFFAFNNPYTGLGASGILIGVALFGFISKVDLRVNIMNGIMGFATLLIPFLYLRMFDPADDRIEIQWGYFAQKATLEGMIAPPGSLLDHIITFFVGHGFKTTWETWINIGLPAVIILLVLGFLFAFRRKSVRNFKLPRPFRMILLSAGLLFIYCSGVLFLPFPEHIVEEYLGFMLMFKAAARLAWPLYYGAVILAVVTLDYWLKMQSLRLSIVVLSILSLLWIADIALFIKPDFMDTRQPNYLANTQIDEFYMPLHESGFNPDEFQAMLLLPKLMMWYDNFHTEVHFQAQFNGIRISLATGLPMINSMLSRSSHSNIVQGIQMTSHPLIERTLLSELPDNRDILLVVAKKYTLWKPGEAYLLSISDTIYTSENYLLMRLPIAGFKNNKALDAAMEALQDSLWQNPPETIFLDFEEHENQFAYSGNGSLLLQKGGHLILDTVLLNPYDSLYEFSAWTHADNKKYGSGRWEFYIYDSNGYTSWEYMVDNRRTYDVQGNWVRSSTNLLINPGDRLQIYFRNNRPLAIDALLLRPVD